MNVITIPAKPQKGSNAAKVEVKKLRVAAYCRVSTDNEEQATSYEAQIAHYREFSVPIPTGCLWMCTPMTVSVQRLPRTVRSSTG